MPIPALRTKQTTNTAGTGTLTLNAASAEFRGFQAALGAFSQPVRYALSRAGVYEVGYGVFNGAAPGTLTRVDVVASSNSGALVSLAAGTTDVFIDFLPGDRARRAITATTTLGLADLGNLISALHSSEITFTLPPIASVPQGMGYLIKNDSPNFSVLQIDPNGAELLDGSATSFPLFAGEAVEVFSAGTTWRSGSRPSGWRQVSRIDAASSPTIDFVLPLYLGANRSMFRVEFRNVRPATDGAFLQMRVDDAGGASFDAGATDYSHAAGYVSGAAAWAAAASTGDSAIRLSTDIDNTTAGNTLSGSLDFYPGTAAARFPNARFNTFATGNGTIYAGPQIWVGGGQRLAVMDVNALRFLMNTGNIATGSFVLSALYD